MNIQLQIRNAAEKDSRSMKDIADFIKQSESRDKEASLAAKNAKNTNLLDSLPVRGESKKEPEKETLTEAEVMHEQGNEKFKQKKYIEALAIYTSALRMYTTDDKQAAKKVPEKGEGETLLSQILGNIGLVYQKMGNEEKALDYYNRALDETHDYTKVLVRRARIYGNNAETIKEALNDYGMALPKLTGAPRSQVQREIEVLREKLIAVEKESCKGAQDAQNNDEPQEVTSSGKKVMIQFDDDDNNDGTGNNDDNENDNMGELKADIEKNANSSLPKEGDTVAVNSANTDERDRKNEVESKKVAIEFDNDDASSIPTIAKPTLATSITNRKTEAIGAVTSAKDTAADIQSNQSGLTTVLPPVPDSQFAFYSALCQLSGKPEALSNYLNSFHTALLPKLLSSQIGERELGSVSEALHLYPLSAKKNVNILFAFMSISDFEVIRTFIDPEIKANIRRVFTKAQIDLGSEARTGVMAVRLEKIRQGYSL